MALPQPKVDHLEPIRQMTSPGVSRFASDAPLTASQRVAQVTSSGRPQRSTRPGPKGGRQEERTTGGRQRRRTDDRREPALGTNASNLSDVGRLEARKARKGGRYTVRRQAKKVRPGESRLSDCGYVAIRPGGGVGLRGNAAAGGESSGYAGVSTCGSVWACPVCASKIAYVRAAELAQVLGWANKMGHTVALLTLTARHSKGHKLGDTWNGITTAWGRTISGYAWAGESDKAYQKRVITWENRRQLNRPRPVRSEGIKDRFGILGWARAVEVTSGDNGWHPHAHIVMVFEGKISDAMIRVAGEEMYALWAKGLASKGYSALRDSGGLDIRTSANEVSTVLAEYLTKQLAIEATHGGQKLGRLHGRTPFQILADFFDTGDADDHDLWFEWERGSKGRQQLTWSKDLREMAGLAAQEQTDEEIAEADEGGEMLLNLPPATWRVVREDSVQLLLACDEGGLKGARAWLDARGLVYDLPPKSR